MQNSKCKTQNETGIGTRRFPAFCILNCMFCILHFSSPCFPLGAFGALAAHLFSRPRRNAARVNKMES
jgi:hypothetical protein